jgi:hypothetical protein
MITGLGWVSLLSGRIQRYRVSLSFAKRCAPANRWATALAGWAAQAMRTRGGRLGRAEDTAQKPNSNKKTFFFLKTVLQITNQFEFKSTLNFNDFYSHNKIQAHFITPRKICNGMNGTNNYLFKYIAL